jgi:3-dehydroquinate synthase
MKKIRINVPHNNYSVYLGNRVAESTISLMNKEKISGNIFIVMDRNVKRLYPQILSDYFNAGSSKPKYITLHATEKNKTFETIQKIHSALIRNKFGRDAIILAVGGGIIGDITGFAASTYMRGVEYIQVPTTLLAAVDSSVGGKTGINFQERKNIIGSFYQPSMVLVDPLFYNTLAEEEMLCGVGEVIKYCFLTNVNFFNYVKKNIQKIINNDTQVIEKIITESINFKSSVVEADEKESGIRKVLNLGHTFAHAFEIQQNHKIKHGQAVIVGITAALYLSKRLNLISPKSLISYLELVHHFKGRIRLNKVDIGSILKIMESDKKNRRNQIRFVLIKDIGEIVTDISAEKKLIKESISESIAHFS